MASEANRAYRWLGRSLETWHHWIVVGMTFVLALVTTGIILITIDRISEAHGKLDALRDTLDSIRNIRWRLIDSETGQRGYLLTNDESYLEPLDQAKRDLPPLQERVREFASHDAQLLSLFSEFERFSVDRMDLLSEIVSLHRNGHPGEALALIRAGRGKMLMDHSRKQLDKILEYVARRAQVSEHEVIAATRLSRIATIGLGALTATLVLVLSYVLSKELRRRRENRRSLETEVANLTSTLSARAEELDRVSMRLQSLSEEEKHKLARELHDEFGGILTAIKMDLAWLAGRTSAQDPELRPRIEEVTLRVDQLIDLKRRVIEDLRPSLIDNLGLRAALLWYAQEAATRAEVALQIELAELTQEPQGDVAIAIFRVVQESITNALKYAAASTLRVSMTESPEFITVTIADDGRGMDLALGKHRIGHGLEGMKYRVESMRGRFLLRSALGEGTVVSASFPKNGSSSVNSEAAA